MDESSLRVLVLLLSTIIKTSNANFCRQNIFGCWLCVQSLHVKYRRDRGGQVKLTAMNGLFFLFKLDNGDIPKGVKFAGGKCNILRQTVNMTCDRTSFKFKQALTH